MRTYSRKRPEHEELENVTELCRLCLEKPNESVPIYSNDNLYSSLALRIMICVGLEMTKEDYISNMICLQCHQEIEKYYSFRKKCEKSYQKLKAHIQSVKTKERPSGSLNTVFTISPNGSISMRDASNSLLENDQPLIMLTKILDDEPKASDSEVLQVFNKTTTIRTENNDVLSDVPSQLVNTNLKPESDQSATIEPVLSEILLPEERVQSPADPEISEFLSAMLTELGIISQQEDGIVELGPKTNRALELETKDGNNIIFELVEEDEEMVNNSGECAREERTKSKKKVKVVRLSKPRSVVKCDVCGKVLASRGVLARHVRNVHERSRPHACPECGMKFAQKEVMARHKLRHQEKRPFQCSLCPKSFTQRSALDTHTRSHDRERPLTLHPCPKCSKLFLYASGLSRHLQQHSNIRFPCEECGRHFSDKSSLKRHQRTMRNCAKQDNAYTCEAGKRTINT